MGETRFQPYIKAGPLHENKVLKKKNALKGENTEVVAPEGKTVVAQFQDVNGNISGPPLNIPANITPDQLQLLLNSLLSQDSDPLPYSFSVDNNEIKSSLFDDIVKGFEKSLEERFTIVYRPQAIFKVRSVARCSATLTGHSEAIIACRFSPDGSMLASGSGDTTVRVWDLNTETSLNTLRGHKNWVQHVCWSPDNEILISAGMDSTIQVWNPKTGEQLGSGLRGHTQPITSLCFEPWHLNKSASRFCSASKDNTIRVWDCRTRKPLFTMSQHTQPVMCVKWGGDGLIYSASRDKSIRVWDGKDGKLIRVLSGHAHWVNHLSLSTEFILRSGPFDHTDKKFKDRDEMFEYAKKRYNDETDNGKKPEHLASCSDDFTIFIWEPSTTKKPICRMTGHQQPVNHISFSPDGQYLASASFDKSVKLWDGKTGKFISTLRGHVGAVYQVCWSSDSRQLLSGSKDATLKCWDIQTRKLKIELPGHADEVYTVDWSPSGDRVASGSKDRTLKIWKH